MLDVFDGEPPPIGDDGVPIPFEPDPVAAGLSDLELVADIWASDAREARYVAERAASVAALARRRRIERDREFGPLGGPGLDSRVRRSPVLAHVSETFVSELALIRGCTEVEAMGVSVMAGFDHPCMLPARAEKCQRVPLASGVCSTASLPARRTTACSSPTYRTTPPR